MTHTPTATGALWTCPACPFRATVTTRGLIVTVHADDAAHLAAIAEAQEARVAWAERVVTRLRMHYEGRAALPETDDNCDDLVAAGVRDARTLSLRQLQRLMRYVIAEYSEGA